MEKMLILCGGQGTRMRPITYSINKTMLPVADRPIIENNIIYFRNQGVKNFVLGVGYLAEQIMNYFKDGSKLGVKIEYSIEKEPLGTGGAIKNAGKFFDSTFMMLNGDVFFEKLNIADVLKFHRQNKAIVSIVLTQVKDPSRYGSVLFDDGRILKFVEKGQPVSNWINAGLYVFEPEILEMMPDKGSAEREVFPVLAEQGKLFGYFYKQGYWADIGVLEDYEKVKKDLVGKNFFVK